MKLSELEPRFITYGETNFLTDVPFEQAEGILFLCPGCFKKNGGPVGTHSLIIYFHSTKNPVMLKGWKMLGTGMSDLTLFPSILILNEECRWHGFVRDGEIIDC